MRLKQPFIARLKKFGIAKEPAAGVQIVYNMTTKKPHIANMRLYT